MYIRLLIILALLTSCSSSGYDVSKTVDISADRWRTLRLENPAGFDASHYKDLIEYIFAREPGDHVAITVDVNVSTASINAGEYQPETEVWRLNFQR